MATARKIRLSVADQQSRFRSARITQEQADLTSLLLQENHDRHHIFFKEDGYHNHIAHHLLTVFGLNGTCSDIRNAFEVNKSYQRPKFSYSNFVVRDLRDSNYFLQCLGKEEYYNDFLEFFTREMEDLGLAEILERYLFAQDEKSESMFGRMFLPFLHGIIHLGFGVEFHQPAIVCEALAQIACHDDWMGRLLHPAEQRAQAMKETIGETSKPFTGLLDEIRSDTKLSSSPQWADPNKVRDGIMVRAPDRMLVYLGQVIISPTELEEKVAEMVNLVTYFAAGSQHPPNVVMFDFYFMHCVNASLFLSSFIKQEWLKPSSKVRLLEWKVRADLAIYASRRSPKIKLEEIRNYRPKHTSDWNDLCSRTCRITDDGHSSKLVRALSHGEQICRPYDGKDQFRIKNSDWLQIGHMAVDSTESIQPNGERWVRSAGFEEAWEKISLRA